MQQIGKVDKKFNRVIDRVLSYSRNEETENDKLLLLLESWAGQWSEDIWDVLSLPNFLIKRLKIPKCTTSEGQQLDVGYNIFFNI